MAAIATAESPAGIVKETRRRRKLFVKF